MITTDYRCVITNNGNVIISDTITLPSVSQYAYTYIAIQCAEVIQHKLNEDLSKYNSVHGSLECYLELYVDDKLLGTYKVLLRQRLTCTVVC